MDASRRHFVRYPKTLKHSRALSKYLRKHQAIKNPPPPPNQKQGVGFELEPETTHCHLQQPGDTATSPLSAQPPVNSLMTHISATDGQKMLLQDHCTLAKSRPALKLVLQRTDVETIPITCPLRSKSESFHAASHTQQDPLHGAFLNQSRYFALCSLQSASVRGHTTAAGESERMSIVLITQIHASHSNTTNIFFCPKKVKSV